jgi:hypothetical protein
MAINHRDFIKAVGFGVAGLSFACCGGGDGSLLVFKQVGRDFLVKVW